MMETNLEGNRGRLDSNGGELEVLAERDGFGSVSL
jgi:hypothetical protein